MNHARKIIAEMRSKEFAANATLVYHAVLPTATVFFAIIGGGSGFANSLHADGGFSKTAICTIGGGLSGILVSPLYPLGVPISVSYYWWNVLSIHRLTINATPVPGKIK